MNKSRMLGIANHSRQCLIELRDKHNIEYQGRQKGTLQVFRNQKQLDAVEKDIALLEQSGTRYQRMSVEECIKQEPGLTAVSHKLTGGLYLPDDETGDCYLFCQQMTELAKAHGVEFMFDTQVQDVKREGTRITRVVTDKGELEADVYVVAMGSYSTKFMAGLGLSIPVYPVKGYSLTVPITDESQAPTSTVMDETYKVALTRFDDRIRVAGTAELASFDPSIPEKRKATISMVVKDLFPNSGDFAKAEFWTGFRPMTPDGTPLIGKTPFTNLFTNTGHGTLGWTMACGSGHLLAQIITDQITSKVEGLDYFRYAS